MSVMAGMLRVTLEKRGQYALAGGPSRCARRRRAAAGKGGSHRRRVDFGLRRGAGRAPCPFRLERNLPPRRRSTAGSTTQTAERRVEPESILDFSVSMNLLPPHPEVERAVARAAFDRYPDSSSALRRAIAEANGLSPDEVLVTNGLAQAIVLLAFAFCDREPRARRVAGLRGACRGRFPSCRGRGSVRPGEGGRGVRLSRRTADAGRGSIGPRWSGSARRTIRRARRRRRKRCRLAAARLRR